MVNGYAPKTLAEALELRCKHDLVPYAGGTDRMVENRPNVSYLFLGNGSAKTDSVLVGFVTGAKLRLLSVKGERIVDVEKLYLGRKKPDPASDEIIAEILLPKAGLDDYYYKKVGGRNALAISRVSFAGILSVENGVIARFSAGFGAVADTVLRYRDLEAMLLGKTVAEAKAVKEALLKAYSDRMVLTRGRVSAEYRNTVCMNLLGDFLTEKGI